MKVLNAIIRLNKKGSNYLSRKIPKLFNGVDCCEVLKNIIRNCLEERHGIRILEVGGIDRPLFKKMPGIVYDGLDIEDKLACRMLYDNYFVRPVEKGIHGKYDVIFSASVLEHIGNNSIALIMMYKALKNRGICAHYIPNKLHPYAFITRVIGHSWQRKLIKILRPESIEVTGYRTFYNQCYPYEMKRLFKKVGFKNIKLVYFYRANDYFAFFMPLYIIISIFENMCRLLHIKLFCSGFIIIGKKIAE